MEGCKGWESLFFASCRRAFSLDYRRCYYYQIQKCSSTEQEFRIRNYSARAESVMSWLQSGCRTVSSILMLRILRVSQGTADILTTATASFLTQLATYPLHKTVTAHSLDIASGHESDDGNCPLPIPFRRQGPTSANNSTRQCLLSLVTIRIMTLPEDTAGIHLLQPQSSKH